MKLCDTIRICLASDKGHNGPVTLGQGGYGDMAKLKVRHVADVALQFAVAAPGVPGRPPHKFAMSPMSPKILNLFKNLRKVRRDPLVAAAAPGCRGGRPYVSPHPPMPFRHVAGDLVLFLGATSANHMAAMAKLGRGQEDMKRRVPRVPRHCTGGWGGWRNFAPAAAATRPTFTNILKQLAIGKLGGQ